MCVILFYTLVNMPPRASKPVLSRFIKAVETKASGRKFNLRAHDHSRKMRAECSRTTVQEAVECSDEKLGLKK